MIVKFDAVFGRTHVGVGVISRTPGDKVTVKKRSKIYITGCASVGGGVI